MATDTVATAVAAAPMSDRYCATSINFNFFFLFLNTVIKTIVKPFVVGKYPVCVCLHLYACIDQMNTIEFQMTLNELLKYYLFVCLYIYV